MAAISSAGLATKQNALQIEQYVNARMLAPGVAETVTIPAGARYVVFGRAGDDFWARFDGVAAAVPVADISDGTSSVPNPVARQLGNATTISIITAGSATVTAAFYK